MYPDIGFTSEYQELFKDTAFGGESCHFQSAGIDYRFYKRPIKGTPYFDIVSPYGYSGPVEFSPQVDWAWFLSEFHAYCESHDIIAEFVRLHPFETHIRAGYYEREIYYIDLTQSEEQIWKGFDKGCKSAAKSLDGLWGHEGCADRFPEMYRRKAIGREYLFSDEFFQQASPMVCTFGDENAIALFLRYGNYCHYWLSSGKSANVVIWGAIKWAKSQGCKIFNLGGGLKSGDSLESFKRSFTKNSKPFYTYRKVHNEAVYDELCREIDPRSEGFFPAYRRGQ